jgi:hypothetical protein
VKAEFADKIGVRDSCSEICHTFKDYPQNHETGSFASVRFRQTMRIGFDVAQTCVEKAGCGWVAALLAKALAEVAPGDELSLNHHFGEWLNADTLRGVRLSAQNVREPFREMSIDAARELWTAVASGARELPGNPEIVHANSYRAPKVGSAKLPMNTWRISLGVRRL